MIHCGKSSPAPVVVRAIAARRYGAGWVWADDWFGRKVELSGGERWWQGKRVEERQRCQFYLIRGD